MKPIVVVILCYVAYFALSLEHRTEIMFDPETDGPIRIEPKAHNWTIAPAISTGGTLGSSGGACLTSMAYAAGANTIAVMTPCSTSSAYMTTSATRKED